MVVVETVYPSPHQRDLMTAYLGGYIEEGSLTAIPLATAIATIRACVPPTVTVDGMIASRILRRLNFNRGLARGDALNNIYRSAK